MSLKSSMGYFKGASFNLSHAAASALTDHSIISAPATGYSLYITDIHCDAGSGASGQDFLLECPNSTTVYNCVLAQNGSRDVMFKTPVKCATATALTFTCAQTSTGGFIVVNGFVASDAT
jgi:hypothetical protein